MDAKGMNMNLIRRIGMMRSLRGAMALLAIACGACGSSDSSNTPDAGNLVGGGDSGINGDGPLLAGDAPVVVAEADCTTLANGAVCGEQSICVNQQCAPSRCGDGFVNVLALEECDDGNDMVGDGCSLCRFDCKANQECDDTDVCNGSEICDLAKHVCGAGTVPAAGTSCTLNQGVAGACNQGQCAKAGCGNSIKDAGEDCDDGNNVDTDGCTSKCTFTCVADKDCDNGNACDGVETCNVATHGCKQGKPISCGANGCAGVCDPNAGACVYADVDKDGASCDADCNDADPSQFPGAFECKDGKDNDCSMSTADSSAPSCECYVDGDRDGFASSVEGAIAAAGVCPIGYTRTKPIDAKTTDCAPKVAAANPVQKSYFPTSYCTGAALCINKSFDYNCDTKESSSFTEARLAAASCIGAKDVFSCVFRSGWVAAAVPVCGGKGTFRQCSFANGVCTGVDLAAHPRSCN
ncbi:MAG: putative metal-binding motif-containing protein [Deltaproteobacteria bacterium]|nr:putative metal-binding motif-containing protein [Deltaproteobacteria bacterium]